MFRRNLTLSDRSQTFFLWGTRQTGKSTLLRASFPDVPVFDLLKSDEYARFIKEPHGLRAEVEAADFAFIHNRIAARGFRVLLRKP